MNILLIEPYYGGSHRTWADRYSRYSNHQIRLLTLPAQFWKWRMQGGAVTLARLAHEQQLQPDVILASDMFDLATFLALTRQTLHDIPVALYFHETQLSYPQNSRQNHGWQYGFINYASAMAADVILFNSQYHHDDFFATLPNMLKHFPDFNELQTVDTLRQKASVLSLGLDLKPYNAHFTRKETGQPPLILWNHRWEEDKNPRTFFESLYILQKHKIPFRVAITGENFRQNPSEFEEARIRLSDHIVQYGYIEDFAEYARLLWQADYIVSAATQEFFGSAVAEAVYCGCIPILPDRLNYPYLIPESRHDTCLYPGHALAPLLTRHLTGDIVLESQPFQDYIAQFDWSIMAPRYDGVLSSLAAR